MGSFNYLLLNYLLRTLSLTVPLIMIEVATGTSFPLWLLAPLVFLPILLQSTTLLAVWETLYHLLFRPGLYVIALICTIAGEQDIVAILFYVITALQAFNIGKWFIHYIVSWFAALKE